MVGRIYLARIYFTDMSEYKIRPVIVIKQHGQDCICLPLTSQLSKPGIKLSNKDLVEGALKTDSVVIFPKSFTLHQSVLIKHIATVAQEKQRDVFSMFCEQIGCK